MRHTKIYIVFVILLLSVQDFKAQQRISDSLSVYFEVGRSEVLWGESAVDTAYYIYSRYASNPGFYMRVTGYTSPDGDRARGTKMDENGNYVKSDQQSENFYPDGGNAPRTEVMRIRAFHR